MSDPIKPFGGPVSGPPAIEQKPVSETERHAQAEETGRAEGVSGTSGQQGIDQSSELNSIVRDLQTGKLDVAEAVDKILEHSLEKLPPGVASDSLKAEMEGALRSALETDVTLKSLINELETKTR